MNPLLDDDIFDEDMTTEEDLAELIAQLVTRLPQPSAGHWTQAYDYPD